MPLTRSQKRAKNKDVVGVKQRRVDALFSLSGSDGGMAEVISIESDGEHGERKRKGNLERNRRVSRPFTTREHSDSSKKSLSEITSAVRRFNSSSPYNRPFEEEKHSQAFEWVDKYTPKTSQDIAINPKKLEEVRTILSQMINHKTNKRLLVLSGPAGSSKSTTIKILSDELVSNGSTGGGNLSKYFMEATNGEETRRKWLEFDSSTPSGSSSMASFSEFLNDAKYKTGNSICVILIEDLPNIFHNETRYQFQKSIMDWLYVHGELPPLVVCLTETDMVTDSEQEFFNINNCLNSDTLLGRKITGDSKVALVKFNAIAKSFLMKPIKKIIESEKEIFKRISKSETDEFLSGIISTGDIRSTICSLQFWASWKYKARNSKEEKYLNFGRENHINLFHCIGKIIFGSSKSSNDDIMDGFKADYYTINEVLRQFPRSSTLQLSLLENYCSYNNRNVKLEVIGSIAENFSIGDTLSSLDEGYEIGIRGTRTNLRLAQDMNHISNGSSGHHGTRENLIKYSRHVKVVREFNKTRMEIDNYRMKRNLRYSFDDMNLYAGYYEPLIMNSLKFKTKHNFHNRARVGRIGGSFKQIVSDNNIPLSLDDISTSGEADMMNSVNEEEVVLDDLESELSDPIVSSDGRSDDDVFNDSFDDEIDFLLSQTPKYPYKGISIASSINVRAEKRQYGNQESQSVAQQSTINSLDSLSETNKNVVTNNHPDPMARERFCTSSILKIKDKERPKVDNSDEEVFSSDSEFERLMWK